MIVDELEILGLVLLFILINILVKNLELITRRGFRFISYRDIKDLRLRIDEIDQYIDDQKKYEKEHGKYSLHNKPREE